MSGWGTPGRSRGSLASAVRLNGARGGRPRGSGAGQLVAAAASAEGAAEASPEALSYPPSAPAGGDALMLDAPEPGEVRCR